MKHLFTALILTLSVTIANGQNKLSSYPWEDRPVTYIAHRSLHLKGVSPENSLRAIEMAAYAGYKMVEIDTRSTVDGEIIVMHDATINRTCCTVKGGKIKKSISIAKSTFNDLRTKYRLRNQNGKPGEVIPTFEEMIQQCKKCGIYPLVHHKISPIDKVVSILQKYFGENFIMFTSDVNILRYTRKCCPNCKIMYSISPKTKDGCLEILKEIGGNCSISTMDLEILDKEFTQKCISLGIDVQASTADYLVLPNRMEGEWTYLLSNVRHMPISNSDKQNIEKTVEFKAKDFVTNGKVRNGVYTLNKGEKLLLNNFTKTDAQKGQIGVYDIELTLKGSCQILAPNTGVQEYHGDNSKVAFSVMYTYSPCYMILTATQDCTISNLTMKNAIYKVK
ncbi:MAG: glycerophosphodiester phosphodiesterase family protein [Alistipes sp.]|nr:glycerophosphodiester phosphodiesterase family protein [Candidatus Alistipes equi]